MEQNIVLECALWFTIQTNNQYLIIFAEIWQHNYVTMHWQMTSCISQKKKK